MAQSTDIVLSDQLGAPFRDELNKILSALGTNNSGNSEPLNTYQFMKWVDTSNATYYYIKERNHDNTAWVTLFRYTVATKIMEAVSSGVVLSQTNIASEIHASSSKTTPVDADEIGIWDSISETLKKLTWANLKATLKTYLDTIYVALTGTQTIDGIKTFSSSPIVPTPITDFQASTKKYTDDSLLALTFEKIVQGTVVNSTSGTSIDFTGIPSWAKKITVMFNGVSTSGTSNFLVQIGSGSVDTTGYASSCSAGASVAVATNGFISTFSMTSTYLRMGEIHLNNITSNIWQQSGILADSSNAVVGTISGGSKTLSSTLDRIRITTVNGTDTFDAGQIGVLYEG